MNSFFIHTMARLTCLSALLACAGANAAGAGPAGNPRLQAILRQRQAELAAQQQQDQAALVSQMECLQRLERQLRQATRGIRTGRVGGALANSHTTAIRDMRAEIVRLQAALQNRAGRITAINQQLTARGAQPAVPVAPQVRAVARLARGELIQQRAYGAWREMQTALTGNLGRLRSAVERVADAVAEALRMMPQNELNQLLRGNVQQVRDAQAAAGRAANPADAAAAARNAVDAASEAAAAAYAVDPAGSELSGLIDGVASSIASVEEDARSVASSLRTVALPDPRVQGGAAYAASSIADTDSVVSQAFSAYSTDTVNLADPRGQARSIAATDQGSRSAASQVQSVPFGRSAASVHSTGVFSPPASQASRQGLFDAEIDRWLDTVNQNQAADAASQAHEPAQSVNSAAIANVLPDPRVARFDAQSVVSRARSAVWPHAQQAQRASSLHSAGVFNPPASHASQHQMFSDRMRRWIAERDQAGPAGSVVGSELAPEPAASPVQSPIEQMREARLRNLAPGSVARHAQAVRPARSVASSRASVAGESVVDDVASSHSAASPAGTSVSSRASAAGGSVNAPVRGRVNLRDNADNRSEASAAGSSWGNDFFGERG